MKSSIWLLAVGAALTLTTPRNLFAFGPHRTERLPDLDKRPKAATTSPAGSVALATPARAAALARLQGQLAGARVDFDEIAGTVRFIHAGDGFLTGEEGNGAAIGSATLAVFDKSDPNRLVKAFLREHRELFGHGEEVLNAARVEREFVTPHNLLRTVVWQQELDGIEIFEAVLIAHTTGRGELVNLSSGFLADAASAADAGVRQRAAAGAPPSLSAMEAAATAWKHLGDSVELAALTPMDDPPSGLDQRHRFRAETLKREGEARLIWLPMAASELRLCWEVVLTGRARGEMFRVLVDAQAGGILLRRSLTACISDATYRVFTSDSPSPFSPGHPVPLDGQPQVVPRGLLTLPALATNASPNGWIDDGVNETRGNNVDAHTDRNNDNQPDLPRPQGSPFRTFDFPLDLARPPTASSSNAVVQLFYWCNWMHDKLYELGFTEAAGNFQVNNFGRGGLGNDAVQADAQDGAGTDNANMSTPPDGSPPRMQMFLFTGPNPDRDGDYDAEVILHEYTHGLSNRRVGGGVGISQLQTAGMGEGWSDFYGLALLAEPGDDLHGNYAAGGYLTYELIPGFTQNYYFGIRRYPYSTDLTKNPLTFRDIDPAQASPHDGVPLSPLFEPWFPGFADEVHNQGEVWCATLWDARASLVAKHGFEAGNQLILRLVTDGMNLSPVNPNFLQARDAILQADRVNNGGSNLPELWAAFAKRGMGFSATSPASSTTAGVRESFDPPDDLLVTPLDGLVAKGPEGGPFAPPAQAYTLTNGSTNLVVWSVLPHAGWVSVSPASGSLTPGGPAAIVTVAIDRVVNNFPSGEYADSVVFSNHVTHATQNRSVTLLASSMDYFTELFDDSTNDLDNQTFTFTPDGSTNYYAVCRQAASAFPTDPAGGTSVSLTDDDFAQVTLASGATVSFYGNRSSVFFIGSNGYLTQNEGDSSFGSSLAAHFRLPRVAALFDDLDPSTGGTVSWRQLGDRVAVTYQNVPEFGVSTRLNNFQIELFFDGRIRVTYLAIASSDGLAGLSRGTGVPPGFVESDFSAYGLCGPPWSLVVPTGANEDVGLLAGQGQVRLSQALTTNLQVTLVSSDTTALQASSGVLIPAGETNAVFDLTVVDDAALDGTQTASITASASDFNPVSALVRVFDNETAVLQVHLPATATEGQGQIQGTVTLSAAPASAVAVKLTSSDITEVQPPVIVVIPAGQTSAAFTAALVNDVEIDGPQAVTLTAHVQNWTDGSGTVEVLDDEALTVSLTLPASGFENRGVWANAGQIRLAGITLTNLTVALVSSLPGQLIVPATVTIPAGQSNRNFNLTFVDDPDPNGDRTAAVTGSAAGFTPGSGSIRIVDDDTPPVFVTQPASQIAAEGQTVRFNVTVSGGAPLSYQWRFNGSQLPGATATALTLVSVMTNQSGAYDVVVTNRFGAITSLVANLEVWQPPPALEFRIVSLTANNSRIVDHNALTGDDRGGIAASATHVFYSGDDSTAGFRLADLSGGTALGTVYDAMVGDLQSGKVYSFADDNGVLSSAGGVATRLIEHDGPTGALTTNAIPLTAPIPLLNPFVDVGLFAGLGRILVHNGTNAYDIRLPLGLVINLGAMTPPPHQASENWAYWGIAEYYSGTLYLTCVRNSQSIARTAVPRSTTTILASFSNLSDMASITASLPFSRWYFHYEGSGQFGGSMETLGFADATFSIGTNTPPTLVSPPQSQVVERGGSATFAAGVFGTQPLSYQWWFSNHLAVGESFLVSTSAVLGLNDVDTNRAGQYWVVVTNLFGATNSPAATLTLLPGITLAEALDGPGLSWTTSGDAFWKAQTNVTHDGVDAAVSGAITHNQQSSLQATVIGPGTLTFWWRVSSESGFDYLRYYRGSTLDASISGEANWALRTFNLPSGAQTLRWTYSKDGSVNARQDKGWLDQVTYTPTGPPVITAQPQAKTVNEGSNATFTVTATGLAPLRYQWRFGTEEISGATNAALVLLAVQTNQAGNYSVRVSNTLGTVASAAALLRVNRVPSANPQSTAMDEDSTAAMILSGSDPDGDALSFEVVTGPVHGILVGTPPNVIYRPFTNYFGLEGFTFRVSDGRVASAPASVSIVVRPLPDPPLAFPQSVTVNEDHSVIIALAASDPDGDALTYSVTAPLHGTLTGVAPDLVYHPHTNYNGPDGFNFQATDSSSASGAAPVGITVLPVNDSPIARIQLAPLAVFPGLTNLMIISPDGSNAVVDLDASQSTDVENDPLHYTWSEGTNLLATGLDATNRMSVGPHLLTLEVSDGQKTGSDTASFDVLRPAESVGIVLMLLDDSGLQRSRRRGLEATLKAAAASFERGDGIPAVNQLQAFQNKVLAQVLPTDPVLAAQLIEAAQTLIEAVGGP